MIRVVVLSWLLIGAMGHLQAQPVLMSELDISAQQRQLDVQRKDLARQTQEDNNACHDRFAVNDCLKAARMRNQEKNAELRRRQESLNDLQRQRNGQERIFQLEEKKLSHEQGLRDAAARPDARAERGAQGKNGDTRQPQHGNESGRGSIKSGNGDVVRPQPAAAGESQQVYQRKLQDAERRRQERDKRVAEKAGAKRSAPLPAAP